MSFVDWLSQDSEESVGSKLFIFIAGAIIGHLYLPGAIGGVLFVIGVEYLEYRRQGDED